VGKIRVVMKFGGTSIADQHCVGNVSGIVVSHVKKGFEVVVVVSALSGVTDQLLDASEKAKQRSLNEVLEILSNIEKRHLALAKEAIQDNMPRKEATKVVRENLDELRKVLTGISYLGEATPRSKDYVLSFGERLSAPIICGALIDHGLKSEYYTGGDAGIVTNSNFGEALPIMNVTKDRIQKVIGSSLTAGNTPVISGFIAASEDGSITTLGRGGSDYTAVILGVALDADEVWFWTDSDGLLTADPKIEPLAKTIPEISFQEAIEMAIFGAKRMHPRALEPAIQVGPPVRIRNVFKPEAPGTIITEDKKVKSEGVVKALTLFANVALINVEGVGMVGIPGTAAKIFETLGRNGINILLISQSSSEANISFIISRDKMAKTVAAIERDLIRPSIIREVTAEKDVCVISAVGAGMRGTPGIAAMIFGAIARKNVNIRMIAQGSSELNISFVVSEKDGKEALRALHKEFALGELS
jgi:aspartate kinase